MTLRTVFAAATFALIAGGAALSAPVLLQQSPEEAAKAAGGIHTFTKDGAKLESLLRHAGWVSPHLKGRVLYMVSFRSCPDCIRFEKEEFPDLQKAGVDTRVIVIARRPRSTAAERTGVANLWATRSWKAYEDWTSMPIDAFTGEGMPSGDTDPKRAALVEKGRVFIDDLTPLLAENGVEMRYPTLIWKAPNGQLRGCACEQRETYRYIRSELGLPG